MTSVWADTARFPSAVFDGAARHARELGRGVASDDLFLLALMTDLNESEPARRALTVAGVNSAELLEHIRSSGDDGSRPLGDLLRFAPAFYTLQGLAQGFAATLGDGVISAEDVLLALLWTGGSHALAALRHLGVSREAIVQELSQLGVPVPQAKLPRLIEVEWGERVWFDRDQIGDVLDHLRLHVDPKAHWGFNYEADRAWIRAERSVDMDALVRGALPD